MYDKKETGYSDESYNKLGNLQLARFTLVNIGSLENRVVEDHQVPIMDKKFRF